MIAMILVMMVLSRKKGASCTRTPARSPAAASE
jgi:hypothetical protein